MDKLVKGVVWTVAALLLVGGLLRAVAFKAWKIPDDPVLAASIAPTLAAGDSVLVLTIGEPEFGELVRCRDPEDPTAWVVGRIAGFENDVVEFQGRQLTVNGTRYDGESRCSVPTFVVAHPSTGSEIEGSCDVVTMGGGWHYRGTTAKPRPGSFRTQVGPGMVYLVSDNRDLSDDSRDFGPLPRESCKERIVFRVTGSAGWRDSKSRLTYIH